MKFKRPTMLEVKEQTLNHYDDNSEKLSVKNRQIAQ